MARRWHAESPASAAMMARLARSTLISEARNHDDVELQSLGLVNRHDLDLWARCQGSGRSVQVGKTDFERRTRTRRALRTDTFLNRLRNA